MNRETILRMLMPTFLFIATGAGLLAIRHYEQSNRAEETAAVALQTGDLRVATESGHYAERADIAGHLATGAAASFFVGAGAALLSAERERRREQYVAESLNNASSYTGRVPYSQITGQAPRAAG